MKKDQFLELAGQLFDQATPVVNESKIALDKNVFDEIVDQVSSEINDEGVGLIDDYELEMYSREITLESVDYNTKHIESAVRNVLERYFEVK